jgi:hypothetical protein
MERYERTVNQIGYSPPTSNPRTIPITPTMPEFKYISSLATRAAIKPPITVDKVPKIMMNNSSPVLVSNAFKDASGIFPANRATDAVPNTMSMTTTASYLKRFLLCLYYSCDYSPFLIKLGLCASVSPVLYASGTAFRSPAPDLLPRRPAEAPPPSRPSAGAGTESHGRMDHPNETLGHHG